MAELFWGTVESPIGLIEIGATDQAIRSLYFVEEPRADAEDADNPHPLIAKAVHQLQEYFNGTRTEFDLPLALHGTDFQQQVWQQLLTVAYGQMASYRDIAYALDKPKAVRAVGAANGQNPISLIVPCHRIIGSNGKLTGYGGGLWRKEWLLKHEGALLL